MSGLQFSEVRGGKDNNEQGRDLMAKFRFDTVTQIQLRLPPPRASSAHSRPRHVLWLQGQQRRAQLRRRHRTVEKLLYQERPRWRPSKRRPMERAESATLKTARHEGRRPEKSSSNRRTRWPQVLIHGFERILRQGRPGISF